MAMFPAYSRDDDEDECTKYYNQKIRTHQHDELLRRMLGEPTTTITKKDVGEIMSLLRQILAALKITGRG